MEAQLNACLSARVAVQVTIDPPVTLSIQAALLNITLGQSVALSARVSPAVPATYAWTGPGLLATAGASVTAQPATVGAHTYTVGRDERRLHQRDVGDDRGGRHPPAPAWPGATEPIAADAFTAEAYPNPFSTDCRLRLSTTQAGPAQVTIYDLANRAVGETTLDLRPGEQETRLPLPLICPPAPSWCGWRTAGRSSGCGW